jgi:hypothetical protein
VGNDHRRLGVARRAYTRTFDESVDCITSVHTLDVFGKAEADLDARSLKGKKTDINAVAGDVAYVSSPAFFGESCLWNDEPAPADYGCKTLTRCEFTTVTRSDVDYVISELPYLVPRFLAFRDYVMDSATLLPSKVHDGRTENNAKWDDDDASVDRFGPPPSIPQTHPSFVPDPPEKSAKEGRTVGWID